MCRQCVVAQQIFICLIIVIWVAIRLRCQSRICFYCQTVCRNMRRIKRHDITQRPRPVIKGFARSTINNVEIESLKPCFAHARHRALHVLRVMRAPKRLQNMIDRRLHTNTDSIYPARTICLHHLKSDVVGVALDRHFAAFCKRNLSQHTH